LGQHSLIYHLRHNYLKPYTSYDSKDRTRINGAIRAKELRVIGAEGENLGVITREVALAAAETANLDLIEMAL